MVDLTYMANRKKYARPQGLLFSNNPGTVEDAGYVPSGNEFGDYDPVHETFMEPDWMVLTDDNRKDIGMSFERVEQRKRMINAQMRSVHVADKLKISVNWEMIPSRAFDIPNTTAIEQSGASRGTETDYSLTLGIAPNDPTPNVRLLKSYRYTTDGGAGGADMLQWYKDHPGPFWVYLAYDKLHDYDDATDPWAHLAKYNDRVEMYFAEFTYDVVKRGSLFDFWNVSLSLEEV